MVLGQLGDGQVLVGSQRLQRARSNEQIGLPAPGIGSSLCS